MATRFTKDEVHRQLRQIHDEIKQHPFRMTFQTRDIASYKRLLYNLTEAWCNLIWHCSELTDEEQRLYRQFGRWIHDYRQELRTWDKEKFPMDLFPYYEQMLQITHIYLDTGIFDTYYNPDCFWDEQDKRYSRVEKYQIITKEMCGIDSPVLPKFFPVSTRLVTDERVKEYILTRYPYDKSKTEQSRLEEYAEWERNTKPILEWINSNIKDDCKWTHPAWKSAQ